MTSEIRTRLISAEKSTTDTSAQHISVMAGHLSTLLTTVAWNSENALLDDMCDAYEKCQQLVGQIEAILPAAFPKAVRQYSNERRFGLAVAAQPDMEALKDVNS